jgi:hypothetical protein
VNAVTVKSFFLVGLQGQKTGDSYEGRNDLGQYDEKEGVFRQ